MAKIGGGAGIDWTSSVTVSYDVDWVEADWFEVSSEVMIAG